MSPFHVDLEAFLRSIFDRKNHRVGDLAPHERKHFSARFVGGLPGEQSQDLFSFLLAGQDGVNQADTMPSNVSMSLPVQSSGGSCAFTGMGTVHADNEPIGKYPGTHHAMIFFTRLMIVALKLLWWTLPLLIVSRWSSVAE